MPGPIGRFDPRFWRRRADKYRDDLMGKDMLVPHRPYLKRVAILHFARAHGGEYVYRHQADEIRDLKEVIYTLTHGEATHPAARAARMTRLPGLKRLWQVGWFAEYGSRDRVGWHCELEWESLVMAQGSLEALNYHHARFLLTADTPAAGL